MDLRGHGNSAWAPGALYSLAEHVLDLSALVDVIHDFPVTLIGHSLGGIITLLYSGVYPDRVRKAVSIEGLGLPAAHPVHKPAARTDARLDRGRPENRAARAAQLSRSGSRRRSDEGGESASFGRRRRHLTLHGTNWNCRRFADLEVRQLRPQASRPMATDSRICAPSSARSRVPCCCSGAWKAGRRTRKRMAAHP